MDASDIITKYDKAREELIAEHIAEAIREMPKLDIPRVIEPKYNTR